jgi:phosphate transport system protein
MNREHTVKSYNEEMRSLQSMVIAMAQHVEDQMKLAIQVIESRDEQLAQRLVAGDQEINELQEKTDQLTVRILATRQPMAIDLRAIVSVLKIVAELERIADYAASMGKLVHYLNSVSLDELTASIQEMHRIALSMLSDSIKIYQSMDPQMAVVLWHRDDEIDEIYQKFLKQLQSFMSQSPDRVQISTGLLFMGRNCERMGDHLTNIAENIFFIATGKNLLKTTR